MAAVILMGYRTAFDALWIGMLVGIGLAAIGVVPWKIFWFTFMVISLALSAIYWRDLKNMILDAPLPVRIVILVINGVFLLVALSAMVATVLVSGWSALSPF